MMDEVFVSRCRLFIVVTYTHVKSGSLTQLEEKLFLHEVSFSAHFLTRR